MGLLRRNKKPADANTGKDGEIILPPLDLKPNAFSKDEAQGVIIAVRQLPGFPTATTLLAQALTSRVDRILMDFSAQGVAMRFRIDGHWEAMPPLDRPTGDGALVVLKKIFGMNANERRARQNGKCNATISGVDWMMECMSQGVPSGERVMISIEPKKPILKSLEDLGMRDAMQENLRKHMNADGGLVIISAPAGQGLPTSWKLSIEAADRFVRDYISIEDKKDQDVEIINVTKTFFDSSAGETPEAVLLRRLLKQPDAFILPSLYNEKFVELVLEQLTKEKRHAITRLVANDAIDALLTLLSSHRKYAKELLKVTRVVLNQRLVRRLCDKCKVAFQPTPQLLQKLGIPAGRVQKLYQPFIPPPPDQRVDAKGNPIEIEICKQCGGRGYFGRIAIYELLELTEDLKAAILKNPTPDAVRKAAAQFGHRSFQQEGVLAVALGITSLQEMQRMMQAKT